MSPHRERGTFVVRIWWEDNELAGCPIWHAWVQHVSSGEALCVGNVVQLLGFIERWVGELGDVRGHRDGLK